MKFKIASGKRGFFILRWNDGTGWKERTTELRCTASNRFKAYELLSRLKQELAGELPPSLMLSPRERAVVSMPDDPASPSVIEGDWEVYRQYAIDHHFSAKSKSYQESLFPIVDQFQRVTGVTNVRQVTKHTLRKWIKYHHEKGIPNSTIRGYMKYLRAFLIIAIDDGILKEFPKVRLPSEGKKRKGRALTEEEFDRILDAVDKSKLADPEKWKRVLRGAWLSGLRIGEMYRLTWDASEFYVDIDGEVPVYVIRKQKNKNEELLPIVGDFVEWLNEVPKNRRRGFVFPFPGQGTDRVTQRHAERIISRLGEAANVVTLDNVRPRQKTVGKGKNKRTITSTTKTASIHDFRRSFGTRWSMKPGVTPQVLMRLMRHSDIKVTMEYYVDADLKSIAEVIGATTRLGGQLGGQNRIEQPGESTKK